MRIMEKRSIFHVDVKDDEKNIVRKSLLFYLDLAGNKGIDLTEHLELNDKTNIKKYADGSYRSSYNHYSGPYALRIYSHLTDDDVTITITEQITSKKGYGAELITQREDISFFKPSDRDIELIKNTDDPEIIDDYKNGKTSGIVVFKNRLIDETKDLVDKNNLSEVRNKKKKELYNHKSIVRLLSTDKDISLAKISEHLKNSKKLVK